MKKIGYFFGVTFIPLAIWLIFLLAKILNLLQNEQISQIIGFFGLVTQLAILGYASIIFYKSSRETRRVFIYFIVANAGLFLNNLCFNTYVYVLKFPVTALPSWLYFVVYGFFIVWLAAGTVFLVKILVPHILKIKSFIKILLVFAICNSLIIGLFFLALRHGLSAFSGVTISQEFTSVYKLVFFDLIILCLICVEDVSMLLLLSGMAMVTSADFLFNYVSFSGTDNILAYAELSWFLALLLIAIGLFYNKSKRYEIHSCFRATDTIKSKLIIWTFSISIISFLLFFAISYSFSLIDNVVFAGLPFFIMTYSIILVILSVFMGKYFEIPFKKITGNIEVFMLNKDKNKIENKFSIKEFVFLQKFILNVFEVNEEKDRAQKELGIMTAQVAHDIRSPLSALDTIIASIQDKIPERERIMIRTASRRINNIANDLVAKYKGKKNNPDISMFVYVVLKDIISEKDLEYDYKKIQFELTLDNPASAFLLTLGNYTEMRRMISNIINNAVNAMPNKGLIRVFCASVENQAVITIQDSGSGMEKDLIQKLLLDQTPLEIKGLGLRHAKEYMKQYGGRIEIRSVLGKGTELILQFEALPKPVWLCEELSIGSNEELIIVDDDASIHDAWTKKLEGFHFARQDYFTMQEAYEALGENNNKKSQVVLCDYEFVNQSENGLDFLAKLTSQNLRKYLVTSNVDEPQVIARCENMELQLLPKHLLLYVPVYQKKIEKINLLGQSTQEIDAVLIDDNDFNHDFWQYAAGKKYVLRCFFSIGEFQQVADQIAKKTPIYIDLNLENESGLDAAKSLYQQGFLKLYITTGYIDFDIADYPFLSGVTLKKPPF